MACKARITMSPAEDHRPSRLPAFLKAALETPPARIFCWSQQLNAKQAFFPVNACVGESAFVNQLPLTLRIGI
jgi:hypothetical protein